VGRAYKELIAAWRDVLPTQSVCLKVPLAWPGEHDDVWTKSHREEARRERDAPPTSPANADR